MQERTRRAGRRRAWGRTALALGVLLALPATAGADGRCGDPAQRPWCDASRTPEQRTALLLRAMTIDEKVGLMAGDQLASAEATGVSDGVPRLGIPRMRHSDGPFGPRVGRATAMPGPLALAASFDPALAAENGAVIGSEVRHKGSDLVYAPTVEPMRTPLAGRAFEGYGEDPYLAAETAVGWIRGAQGQGVIATVKHFAPNSQEGEGGLPPLTGIEGSRGLVDARIDERTLHEIYLPPFEAAVRRAGVGAVMCAYNSLNGQFACENRRLLQHVLRDTWGFGGFVVSDYYAAMKSTAASVNAGTDQEMPFGLLYGPLLLRAALATGQISEATVDRRVGAILRTMLRFGVFDRPAFRADDGAIDRSAHAAVARRTAEQGTVLLQNRGAALPLPDRPGSLAVIGEVATRYKGGGGSSNVQPFAFRDPLAAIRARAGGARVRYDPGRDPAAAAAAARGTDAAIVFVEDYASEGTDKPCLALRCAPLDPVSGRPLGQIGLTDPDAVVDAVARANPRTIVVLETGGPVLAPWADRVGAVLEAWYPGQEAGPAIARVLFGDVDPGGRLPVTFPARDGDWPTARDRRQYPGVLLRAEYSEGRRIGYRHYDALGIAPRWPFGHGLSYARFALEDLRREPGPALVLSARVTNVGTRPGTAVPQLYLGRPSTGPDDAPRALAGVAKVQLAPGASTRVRFPLDDRAFSTWDVQGERWRVVPGCHRVQVGSSSRDLPLSGGIGRDAACADEVPLAEVARCRARRTVTIALPRGLRRARVTYGGRRASVRRIRGRLRARIALGRVPAGRVVVRIRGRDARGRAVRATRVLRTCAVSAGRPATRARR